jgi:UDP-N-acetylmuramyl pentapeptide phosphotransferase/UDP-N-acetylglucosamine-1-phosphate transferase
VNDGWVRLLIMVATFCVPLAAAMVLAPQVERIGRQVGLIDQPGKDRVNTRPLPRIGGVALYLAFLVGLGLTFVLPVDRQFDPYEAARLALLVIGASNVFVVMLADDAVDLPPRVKLVWQIVAAMLVVLPAVWGERQGIIISDFRAPVVGTILLPLWVAEVAVLFTIFWIVGMMNTINWVDGLDGLAGGVTFIACAVLFAHTYFQPAESRQFTIALLPLLLAGCVAGFLPYNWHPARMIMGDSGAMFLGFALAGISVIGGAKLATTMLALAIPILDVAWLIVARLVRGQSPLQRDARHLHHRLYELGLSQRQVVLIYYGLCAGFGALALLLDESLYKLLALVAAAVVLGVLLLVLARLKPRGTPLIPG